jgi:predicted O-methyltransferase YrrM
MVSGAYQGRLLSILSRFKQPRRILEIGTFTGYSALCLAEGLLPEGELITLEENDELKWIHQKFIGASPVAKQISVLYGDAMQLIPKLSGPFDLVFIDADKQNYLKYYEMTLPLVPQGGALILDNVLWYGKVTQPAAPTDNDTQTLQELNRRIIADGHYEQCMLPIRDGISILIRR